MTRLTPRARRLRVLMIAEMCLQISELGAKARTDRLDDTNLGRCAWCGVWTDGAAGGVPSCQRCTPKSDLNRSQPQ